MKCSMILRPYIIKDDDDYYKLAKQFNTTIESIIDANPNVNPNYLYIGQQIYIPVN